MTYCEMVQITPAVKCHQWRSAPLSRPGERQLKRQWARTASRAWTAKNLTNDLSFRQGQYRIILEGKTEGDALWLVLDTRFWLFSS